MPASTLSALPVIAPRRAAPAELPVPAFYDAANAERWSYRPDQERVCREAATWARAHAIGPSGADTTRVALLLIDLQKDFCFPEGALYVGGRSGRGAIEDNDRIARFVYRNLARLTDVTCTLDTHFPFQIFFASFWLDAGDQPLAPHTVVTTADIREGRVRPNPTVAAWLCNGNYAWLVQQVAFYTEELERAGKYQLYLWPLHCLLGSDGHALAGVIHEARLFHYRSLTGPEGKRTNGRRIWSDASHSRSGSVVRSVICAAERPAPEGVRQSASVGRGRQSAPSLLLRNCCEAY